MKILKLLKKIILIVAFLFAGVYLYFNSDFAEIRSLRIQLENDLGSTFLQRPKLVDKEYYGGIEEGGRKSLLVLGDKDCVAISKKITQSESVNNQSDYFAFFKKNNMPISEINTWSKETDDGGYIKYVLEKKNCVLYRLSHYE